MIRQRLVLISFIFAFIVVVTRLFYWQIVRGVELSEAASDQYYFKLSLTPTRGEILSADKSPLVSNKAAYQVYAEPKKITNQKDFAEKIAELLSLDPQIIEDRVSEDTIVWAPLAHKIDEEVKIQLEALQIPGLGFEKESTRYYPEASMAAQLLGFVGSDENGNDTGYKLQEKVFKTKGGNKSGYCNNCKMNIKSKVKSEKCTYHNRGNTDWNSIHAENTFLISQLYKKCHNKNHEQQERQLSDRNKYITGK